MRVQVHYEHANLADHDLQAYEHKLMPELEAMRQASKGFYENDHASINLPVDNDHLRLVQRTAAKHKKVSLIIVVGIGGSNLGTVAVQEAVLGKMHNLDPGKRARILYADTVDADAIARIEGLMRQELSRKRNVLLSVVSKSGGTTESIANFEVLLQTLQRYKKAKAKDYVIVTTDEGSHFWDVANQQGFAVLPIPKKVGGRYSVLSPVGLFPLAVLGVDIKKLLDGAAHMRAACLNVGHRENPAIIRAAILAHAWTHGRCIADNFYFKTDLESIGKWYRQLMGESIGKEWDREHAKQVHMGITPTVSIGSTDLHSMAQLYFGGPDDKIFTLVTVKDWKSKVKVPQMRQYDPLVHNIQGKPLPVIMGAISGGVEATLRKLHRPYCHIELQDAKEESVGALLQLHMMEMIYLAALLDVNPFDQPNVEDYKIETKRILARKR
jgi:glucose-6-phosphate isomerase